MLVVACFGAWACGPTSVVNRALVEADASTGRPVDAPGSLPSGPLAPTPGNRPPGPPVDPILSPDGVGCKSSSECLSRSCVDGICCQSACDGICQSCDQPGKEGRCLPVGADQDPDNECEEQPATTCGQDGACDGAGACRRYPAGTVCAPGGCAAAVESAASICDGMGTCQPGAKKDCAPAECLGVACGPPCAMDSDCMTGKWCDLGTCRPQREPGNPCDRAAQCGSGFCTEGVCCNMACKEACYSCNLPGSAGSCLPVPDTQDVRGECPVQAITTCGNAGGCNGRGACRKHPSGTFCAHGSCMNGTQFANSTCDGTGNCRRGAGRSCGRFACNGNLVCWNACANNAQCAPGRTCNIHDCQ